MLKKKKKKNEKNDDSLRDFWNNTKCIRICIIVVSEGEEKEKGPENITECIIFENFYNLGK